MQSTLVTLALTSLLAAAGAAHAGTSALGERTVSSNSHLVGVAPPASEIVGAGGMEWVYAGPCAGVGGCGDSMPHHGFHFASAAEWTASFASISDLTTAFAGKCAAPWFNLVHDHCDPGDAAAGYIWHSPLAPDAFHSDHPAAETFMVRAVPEPETYALMIAGLGLLGMLARRRRQA